MRPKVSSESASPNIVKCYGRTDGQCHTIISPVSDGRIKNLNRWIKIGTIEGKEPNLKNKWTGTNRCSMNCWYPIDLRLFEHCIGKLMRKLLINMWKWLSVSWCCHGNMFRYHHGYPSMSQVFCYLFLWASINCPTLYCYYGNVSVTCHGDRIASKMSVAGGLFVRFSWIFMETKLWQLYLADLYMGMSKQLVWPGCI